VVAESGAIERIGQLMTDRGWSGRVLLVTDDNLETLGWRARCADALRAAGFAIQSVVLPAGEEFKSLDSLSMLYDESLRFGLERSDTVIGLGGGVVGDLAGFLAATYMRGVRLVLLPTTLLAQVDASIGGKTGVDVGETKNIAGAFYPARLVVIDPSALATLPERLLADGMAEIVKIGCMRSPALVQALRDLQGPATIRDRPDITWTAARLKTDVVRVDPHEKGIRAQLNFGHTVGHGIEAASDFAQSHGRCVAAGMAAESRVAAESNQCQSDVPATVEDLLCRFGLPSRLPGIEAAAALSAARHDKKRERGTIRVAVPRRIGEGTVLAWSQEQLARAIECAVGGEL